MVLRQRKSSDVILFNRKTIKALQPKDTRYRVWDSEVRGLFVLVFPSGVKSYFLRYRFKNDSTLKTQELSLGSVNTYDEPNDIRRIARDKLILVDKGLNPKVMDTETVGTDYIENLIEEYLKSSYFTDLAITSQRNLKWSLNSHIKSRFKNYRVKDITKDEVRKFYEYAIKHISVSVANSNHRRLSSLMTYAVDQSYIEVNPCIGAIPKKLKKTDPKRFFDIDKDILSKVHKGIQEYKTSEYGNPYSYLLFYIVQYLGFRPSEVVSLRWSKNQDLKELQNYVDLEKKVFIYEKIKNHNMIKKGYPKLVPIPDKVLKLIDELPRLEGNPYLLPANSSAPKKHYQNWQKAWARVEKLGQFKLNLRDLRPVFITLSAFEIGVEETQSYIGHSDKKMTEYYIKRLPEEEINRVNKLFNNAIKKYKQA